MKILGGKKLPVLSAVRMCSTTLLARIGPVNYAADLAEALNALETGTADLCREAYSGCGHQGQAGGCGQEKPLPYL